MSVCACTHTFCQGGKCLLELVGLFFLLQLTVGWLRMFFVLPVPCHSLHVLLLEPTGANCLLATISLLL